MKNKKALALSTIPLVVIVISIGASIGSSNIDIMDILSIIGNKMFHLPLKEGIEGKDVSIIWNLRIPRVLLAFLVGGALSVSGAVVQSVLKNPLASPYTLGVSSGASLGVGAIMLFGISIPFLGDFTLPLVGFICGFITVFLVIAFSAKVDKTLSNTTIILSGMVFSLFFNAMLTILSSLRSNDIKSLIFWQMGSFSMKGWSYVKIVAPFFILGIVGVMFYAREMDILTFGEEQAKIVGVDTNKVKKKLFMLSAVLTGGAVAVSGIIGFVDLVAPHVVRKIFGSNHKYVIPMCMVFGGVLMVITDLISRIILKPSELPVGAITAIIGAPFFAYVYFKDSKRC